MSGRPGRALRSSTASSGFIPSAASPPSCARRAPSAASRPRRRAASRASQAPRSSASSLLFVIAMIIAHAPAAPRICCACACCDLLPREAAARGARARNWLSWRPRQLSPPAFRPAGKARSPLLAPDIDAATGGSGTGAESLCHSRSPAAASRSACAPPPAAASTASSAGWRSSGEALRGGGGRRARRRPRSRRGAQARRRFPPSGLPYASLGEADFATSGDTGLDQKTEAFVTARSRPPPFLSHSRHDSGRRQAEVALSSRGDLEEADAPSTLLWPDKACINQSDIDASLAALPVRPLGAQGAPRPRRPVVLLAAAARTASPAAPRARTRAPTSRRMPHPGGHALHHFLPPWPKRASWSSSRSSRCAAPSTAPTSAASGDDQERAAPAREIRRLRRPALRERGPPTPPRRSSSRRARLVRRFPTPASRRDLCRERGRHAKLDGGRTRLAGAPPGGPRQLVRPRSRRRSVWWDTHVYSYTTR